MMALLVLLLVACQAPADWRPQTAAHLTARAVDWVEHTPDIGENVRCAMSCHTTHPYLIVRPLLGPIPPGDAYFAIRAKIDARVGATTPFYGTPGSAKERESFGSEAVLNAATFALADRATGVARPITKAAFARMWERQRADGGFDWLDFGLQPFEAGGDWGATLAALAAGVVGERGPSVDRLVAYLRGRLPRMTAHERVGMLRAGATLRALLDDRERAALVAELEAQRGRDGGWGDAYTTAYATLALCENGRPDARGLAWLRAHRRDDGSWSGHGYMADAATAYAALALSTCPSP